ncbi:DUF1097 domain-containing protein [Clostridium sp. CX1]|uniref:DUF1097 domain-containing protein n=1 Tax=Clostridium tanneri TaxID=3037988 RepID=A0ABU4JVI3_9CLOT|nr:MULTISPECIES: DUF1097 domain-containing protein [unclassified Clostridium]MCT8975566.1 DUF1097 domain-containing protein [Clostridium sp. CX1]MDW8801966.1 DUF1097 domain-containing protein [Clostridium sp. A1-XYC3]
MSGIMSGAISMGILAWIWSNFSTAIGVQAWAGFMGTTTYYGVGSALGERFVKGWLRGIFVNMVGVAWAIFCVEASNVLHIPNIVAIMTGVISFGIVAEAKWKHLMFVPGVYIGCSTTFGMMALGHSYLDTAAVLLMGSVVGLVSDAGGAWLEKITNKNKKVVENAEQQA